jgi:catechol 2,3-dioxygenase-like lactoylglutathione lyase family enzyme
MNIIDHLSVGVPSIEPACEFYDAILHALGVSRLAVTQGFAAYGDGAVQFLVMVPENGAVYTPGNGTHICFNATSRDAVDAFHRAALAQGGRDAGQPGPRPGYPVPDVYTCFVKDPFGNKLEAIHNGFSPRS